MKKILLLLLLPFAAAHAQPVYETVYATSLVTVVNFTDHGDKYMVSDLPNSELRLYELNHALWKTISIPTPPVNSKLVSATLMSDKLLNNDGFIEFSATYLDTVSQAYECKIYNEINGFILGLSNTYYFYTPMMADGSYKMISYSISGSGSKIYSLPGSLPCVSCAALKVGSTQKQRPHISDPAPNPSAGQFTINYFIPPNEVATLNIYSVSGQVVHSEPMYGNQNTVTINAKLPAGSYYYNMQSEGEISESKKLTIR